MLPEMNSYFAPRAGAGGAVNSLTQFELLSVIYFRTKALFKDLDKSDPIIMWLYFATFTCV
jgi:hypothetical protein